MKKKNKIIFLLLRVFEVFVDYYHIEIGRLVWECARSADFKLIYWIVIGLRRAPHADWTMKDLSWIYPRKILPRLFLLASGEGISPAEGEKIEGVRMRT